MFCYTASSLLIILVIQTVSGDVVGDKCLKVCSTGLIRLTQAGGGSGAGKQLGVNLHTEGQAVLYELLLNLVKRLLTEVAVLEHLSLSLHSQLTNGGDVSVVEAVSGANGKLNLIYAHVKELAEVSGVGVLISTGSLVEGYAAAVALYEYVEVVTHDACSLQHGVRGAYATIGPYVKHELVEFGHLAYTSVIHSVLHAGNGGEDGVNRNDADGAVLIVVIFSSVEATAYIDLEVAVKDGALVKVADNLILVYNGVDVIFLDVTGGHNTLLGNAEGKCAGLFAVVGKLNLLEVENNLSHVLYHAGQRGELVLSTGDTYAGDSSALKGAEKHAAQGVTQCVAETGLNRLSDKGYVVRILRVLNTLEGVRNFEMGQLDDLLLVVLFV